MNFRCAQVCELRGESMAGTASTVRAHLLIEHPGPWGDDALRDARMPEGLGTELRRRSRTHRVRILLMRRPDGRSRNAVGVRVFAGVSDSVAPWLETTLLERVEDVLDLDLAALGAGRSPGLTPHADPVLAVCSHGRHDACCAERGRPMASALRRSHGDLAWEVSHIGGDRFAGNLLALPWGLYFGRVEVEHAPGLAQQLLDGEIDLGHLRGRSSLAMPLQAAEIALRRHLDVRRVDAVRCLSRTVADGVTDAIFEVRGEVRDTRRAGAEPSLWSVTVRSTLGPATALLTCRATAQGQAVEHDVVAIRAVQAQAS